MKLISDACCTASGHELEVTGKTGEAGNNPLSVDGNASSTLELGTSGGALVAAFIEESSIDNRYPKFFSLTSAICGFA